GERRRQPLLGLRDRRLIYPEPSEGSDELELALGVGFRCPVRGGAQVVELGRQLGDRVAPPLRVPLGVGLLGDAKVVPQMTVADEFLVAGRAQAIKRILAKGAARG